MANDAVKMMGDLLLLVEGKTETSETWRNEVPSNYVFRGSRNKPLVCKAAEGFYAYHAGDLITTRKVVQWFVGFCDLPLSAGEELTPEEVYRVMMIFGCYAAAALARRMGMFDEERIILDYVRAHVGWLVLGAGGPGKRVTDHHLDNLLKPVVLIGDGPSISALPYVAQAGMRGWVRNRESGQKNYQFVNSEGLSAVVGLAAAFNVNPNRTKWECDMFSGVAKFASGIAPLGFSFEDRELLRSFLRNTSDIQLAARVVQWCASGIPSADFEYIRYIDGSVIVYMLNNHSSSTDDRMIDSWFKGGTTMKTSADDGMRSSHLAMTVFETPTGVVCSGGNVRMTIPKPNVSEAWRVSVRNEEVGIRGSNYTPPASPSPAPPITTPVSGGNTAPEPSLNWFQRLLRRLGLWKR